MPKIMEPLTVTVLEELEGGRKVVHHHMKTPFVMSDRSLILFYFLVDVSENEFTFAFSTLNSEENQEKYKAKIGKDVVADARLVMHCVADAEGGTRVRMNKVMDPKGSIPTMMANKMAAKQVAMLHEIEEFCKKNIN